MRNLKRALSLALASVMLLGKMCIRDRVGPFPSCFPLCVPAGGRRGYLEEE